MKPGHCTPKDTREAIDHRDPLLKPSNRPTKLEVLTATTTRAGPRPVGKRKDNGLPYLGQANTESDEGVEGRFGPEGLPESQKISWPQEPVLVITVDPPTSDRDRIRVDSLTVLAGNMVGGTGEVNKGEGERSPRRPHLTLRRHP